MKKAPPFKVVLVEPEIPWNTGNIGRTVLGFGAELHLVGKLGFSLEQKQVRRSGLDYWEQVPLSVHPDARAYLETARPGPGWFFFSARARKNFWDEKIPPGAVFVFGRESDGLPAWLRRCYSRRFFRIPLTGPIRSLNLSTAAGIVMAEAARQAAKGASPWLTSPVPSAKRKKSPSGSPKPRRPT